MNQIIDFPLLSKSGIVQIFRKMLLLLIYLGIQSHFCLQLQASFFPPRSQSKVFAFEEN